MHEQLVDVPTADGPMETFITEPEQDGPFPAVILYMDVWGIRELLYDLARRVATVGYAVLVPDFYYREGKVRMARHDAQGRSISFLNLDKKTQDEIRTKQERLTDTMVIKDTGALLDFLKRRSSVKRGGVGAIGYCMGGRHVLEVAAHYPDDFRASASLHGTSLISDRTESPHRAVDRLRGELYCGFAETDPFAPLTMVDELDRLLKPCAVEHRFEIHKGAVHGYAIPDRDIYDKRAAERDWEMIFAMFHRQIPPYAG